MNDEHPRDETDIHLGLRPGEAGRGLARRGPARRGVALRQMTQKIILDSEVRWY